MSNHPSETPTEELRRITSSPRRPELEPPVDGSGETGGTSRLVEEHPPRPPNPLALTLREVDGRLVMNPDASSLAPACVINLELSPRPICDHEHPVPEVPDTLAALDRSSSSQGNTGSDSHARSHLDDKYSSALSGTESEDSPTPEPKDNLDEGIPEIKIYGCDAMDNFNA